MKEEFDEQFLLWSKAILIYCKKICTTTTAIQTLVKDVDAECELFFDTNVSSYANVFSEKAKLCYPNTEYSVIYFDICFLPSFNKC